MCQDAINKKDTKWRKMRNPQKKKNDWHSETI